MKKLCFAALLAISASCLQAGPAMQHPGIQYPIDSDPCAAAVNYERCTNQRMRVEGTSSGPVTPGDNDALLAQCLANSITDYNSCMAHAPSIIPFLTAYNVGVCEANKIVDQSTCFSLYQ